MQLSVCCVMSTSANDLRALRTEINLGTVRVFVDHSFDCPDLACDFAQTILQCALLLQAVMVVVMRMIVRH
jgi:hypothetical protein